jgi:mono/diheme cytochrome c family protein
MRWGSRLAVLALTLALVLALGCGAPEEKPAPAPAAAATPAPAAPATPPPAAATAPAAGDVARGEATYQQLCASCHGPRGAGDGPAGQALEPKPAHHSDGAYMNALSNEHLFRVIKEGGAAVGKSPAMAPWGGTLDDARIRDVVAFVRSLADPPYTGPAP